MASSFGIASSLPFATARKGGEKRAFAWRITAGAGAGAADGFSVSR
jgi:hypothetical protein